MDSTTILFPNDTVQCSRGDYLINKSSSRSWKVFRVEDLVLLICLVPLRFEHTIELIEEEHLMDSEIPDRWRQIHLLVTAYENTFQSSRKAIEAIEAQKLGHGVEGVCLSINQFAKKNSQVYKAAEKSPKRK
jgi:hypothetical protein